METKVTEISEKKIWVKPQLVVYGNIEKLTTELPGQKNWPGPSGGWK